MNELSSVNRFDYTQLTLKQLEVSAFPESDADIADQLGGLTLEDKALSDGLEEACRPMRDVLGRITTLVQQCDNLDSILSPEALRGIVMFADRVRCLDPFTPSYLKKDAKRLVLSLVVAKLGFFILLKAKGTKPMNGKTLRGTLAVKVPFAHGMPCSIIVQLVNKDTAGRLSFGELSFRKQLTIKQLSQGSVCPKILYLFHYTKNVKGVPVAKAMAFIEGDCLGAFDPSVDICKTISEPIRKTALNAAYAKGDTDTVAFLRENVSPVAKEALKIAARQGRYEDIEKLIKDGLTNERCLGNALEIASGCGHDHVVEFFIRNKFKHPEHITEAIRAAAGAGHKKIVLRLLGVSQAQDDNMLVAVGAAAFNGQEALCVLLLQIEGALKKYGEAALIAAISGKQEKLVQRLAVSVNQATLKKGLFFAVSVREAAKIVEAMIPHIKDFKSIGGEALHIALLASSHDIARFLISKGVDVNYADEEGDTTFMVACGEGDLTTIRQLIDKGVDLRAITTGGLTAIMIAAICGRDEVVTLLLERSTNREEDEQAVREVRAAAVTE